MPSEFELKFLLPPERLAAVRLLLDSRCEADPAFPDNVVCSIYFDTVHLQLLDENRNGDRFKTKVRVRWYESPASGSSDPASVLEVKHRMGERRSKWRAQSPFSSSWLAQVSLEDSALLGVSRVAARDAPIPPMQLIPYVLVKYRRQRYFEPLSGSRISLDTEIRVPKVNSHRLPGLASSPFETTVLEVKNSGGTLPPSLQCVTGLGCRKASFSKYSAGLNAAANGAQPIT
jgi:hypothetical protein